MRVLLIAGGWSSEREVSFSGAKSIAGALVELGHEVRELDPSVSLAFLPEEAASCDFAFINLHGAPGEDGLIQAMLDSVGCPYQGSAPGPSLLALNKAASKSVFRERGIATPEWELMTAPPEPGWRPLIDPPLFAKPNQGGSSLGMTLVKETGELEAIIRRILEAGDACLLEELVDGPEVTCAILGDRPLPLILIEPKDAPYFDYESKYVPGRTLETCPAPIGEQLAARIREASLEAHRTLGLAGYSRADFMVAGGEPLLLETNTLPGMTPTSLVPQAAEAAGYSFSELIAELIRFGLENRGGRA